MQGNQKSMGLLRKNIGDDFKCWSQVQTLQRENGNKKVDQGGCGFCGKRLIKYIKRNRARLKGRRDASRTLAANAYSVG